MAEKMVFIDDFFETEQRKFQEELKKIDKMTPKQRENHFRKFEKEEERLKEHYKRLAGEEELKTYEEDMKRMFEYQPPKEDENHEVMKRLMREMKFVRNADIKKYGLLWEVEEITDDVIVYTYDTPDVKQYKYEYIEAHDSKLTNPWTKAEINRKRKLYEKEYGHWEYTEDDYKLEEKSARASMKESPDDARIIQNTLMFAFENGVIENDVPADVGDKILELYNKLTPTEQKIIVADIDSNVKTATKLREDENISYADYRNIKRDIAEKIRSVIL